MDRLDDTDNERILAELAEHARATFARSRSQVSLSRSGGEAPRRLDGVIKAWSTTRSAGTPKRADLLTAVAPDQLRTWVNIPEVVSAATVTGTSGDPARAVAACGI